MARDRRRIAVVSADFRIVTVGTALLAFFRRGNTALARRPVRYQLPTIQ